jgi:signal peptidase II
LEVSLRKFIGSIRWLFIIATLIVALDQVTKALVRANLQIGEIWSPWAWLTPYARLIHITNTGVAFGLFKGANLVFMILAMIVSAGIIYYYPTVPKTERLIRFALSLQLAGAVGNLIDRIVRGQVTDFISVGNFAIWNVADASITSGVGLLLIGVWFQEKRAKQTRQNADPTIEPPGNES